MTWWNWLTIGLALGWAARSTVHWLGWIGADGVRRRARKGAITSEERVPDGRGGMRPKRGIHDFGERPL